MMYLRSLIFSIISASAVLAVLAAGNAAPAAVIQAVRLGLRCGCCGLSGRRTGSMASCITGARSSMPPAPVGLGDNRAVAAAHAGSGAEARVSCRFSAGISGRPAASPSTDRPACGRCASRDDAVAARDAGRRCSSPQEQGLPRRKSQMRSGSSRCMNQPACRWCHRAEFRPSWGRNS